MGRWIDSSATGPVIADSHMNAFIRVRLALTEDWPTIKPSDEQAWATLHDSAAPMKWSLELIESLHAALGDDAAVVDRIEQWQRGYRHRRTALKQSKMRR